MNFSDRMRASAIALTAVVALSHPGIAHAAETSASPVSAVAEIRETSEGCEVFIAPGQTLPLEPIADSVASFNIREGEQSTLPAGWSVLTNSDGLSITAPATASDGDFAVVEVIRADGDTKDLRVVVQREERQALIDPAGSASSSSWVSQFFGRVAAFFSA